MTNIYIYYMLYTDFKSWTTLINAPRAPGEIMCSTEN